MIKFLTFWAGAFFRAFWAISRAFSRKKSGHTVYSCFARGGGVVVQCAAYVHLVLMHDSLWLIRQAVLPARVRNFGHFFRGVETKSQSPHQSSSIQDRKCTKNCQHNSSNTWYCGRLVEKPSSRLSNIAIGRTAKRPLPHYQIYSEKKTPFVQRQSLPIRSTWAKRIVLRCVSLSGT